MPTRPVLLTGAKGFSRAEMVTFSDGRSASFRHFKGGTSSRVGELVEWGTTLTLWRLTYLCLSGVSAYGTKLAICSKEVFRLIVTSKSVKIS
jgi:hypothetical protein